MSAIFHDSGYPSFLGVPPSFSFQDIAEICAPAPKEQQEARARMQRWERKLGAAWYQHNALLAREFYEAKRAWWLTI